MRANRGGPSGRGLLLALAFLAAFLSLGSCGLETVKVYSPPSLASSGGLLTLTHNAANDAEASSFLGYEIYYRAYQDSQKASDDRSAINTAIGAAGATPESCLAMLESMKFHRFYSYDMNPPLFDIDIATTFNIQMPVKANWYVAEFPSGKQLIYRSESSSDTSVPFGGDTSSYKIEDDDYAGSSDVSSGGTVYFVFFAVAYGVDFDSNFKEIYSFPAGIDSYVSYNP